MRRVLATVAVIAATLLSTASPAAAESVTVPGQGGGPITEMLADNAQRAVDVNIYGPGRPCNGTRWVHATVSWRGEPGQYVAGAACYGIEWIASLEYRPDGDPQSAVLVECPGLTVRHNRAGSFFRIHTPRSCIVEAPNRVRVAGDAVTTGSAIPGEAGPTRLLARG